MTSQPIPFDGVSVLLPSGIHQSRRRLAGQLTADLSALIEALSTASHSAVLRLVDDADPEQFKTWALSVIRALPTIKGDSYGNC